MLFGFDISSVSGLIGQDAYREFFNYPDSLTQGGITAAMPGGSLLGCLGAGYLSDRLGRKPTIQIASFVWMVGAAIQCSSRDQAQLIVGRVVSGVAIGFASTQVPVYVAELSPANIRGRLVGLFQWAVTWGILIMFFITYGCSFIKSTASFRLAWGIQMIPGFLLGLGTLILPESPRWLGNKDRWEEAITIIANVQGGGDVNHPQVLIEVEEIKEQVRIDRESADVTIFDLFKKDSINRTMVGFWAQVWQQLCGMNVMMYYIVYIFTMAGFQGDTNLIPSAIQYIINTAMTVPALLWIDSWGRRPLLLVGCVFMMIWLFATAGILATYSIPVDSVGGNTSIRILIPKENAAASKAVIACSYLFVASFAPTWGPGIWLYCSEIFPLKQRALGSAFCGAANWAFNFALAMFVPSAFTNITWKTYIIFGVFCVVMFFHVFFLFPETKGKSLEEINQIWEEKIPAWRSASFVPRQPSISDIKAVPGAGAAPEFEDKRVVEHQEA
ncbi:hexose transporter Hxt17p [Trichomonascus vanleenenianus]|uniref:sugar porter family MFS transporter n=1 Tax=Trichomonascus vanleenenianus TaxID=2268995 RepID=UPI003ECA8DD4